VIMKEESRWWCRKYQVINVFVCLPCFSPVFFFFFVQSLVDSAMIESEMGDDTATRDGIITIV